ncbi:hypothetical protein VTH8203_00831 [Vibrio thalassae]|uniref:Toxin co-regulated pilus biosynthesis protein Q n=1 Tax=Vibrio thalassae TaxID=1243014 RepID=A0A240EH05_9VIBR|nr:hypothetical protein [Vibrio thalassae]SNX47230.1 hypothetical protein VTH8203_00831 [Vibrio thalassae]
MKNIAALFALGALLSGCTTTPINTAVNEDTHDVVPPMESESEQLKSYPTVEFAQLRVTSGSQTLTAANKLADKLGIEFVEWTQELNPYVYYQLRSKRINLNFEDPQAAFLELFDRSGLLPIYDKRDNSVTVYPFSLNQRIQQPHVFTPKFDRSERQREDIELANAKESVTAHKALEYHFYKGYTVKDTIDAWANHANYSGVIWYFDDKATANFLNDTIQKNDFVIEQSPVKVITKFIKEEKERQSSSVSVTAVYEASTNKLILHPFSRGEIVRSFDIEPTTTRQNLSRIANFYGYTLDYQAPDYKIQTPYSTVLTQYTKASIQSVIQQYPLDIEVIDSSKRIIVRGNKA